jgi:hypothetical protein
MYEHVPEGTPGYKPATMVWLDVTDCGEARTPAKEGSYELQSTPWASTIEGTMLFTAGHAHDGTRRIFIRQPLIHSGGVKTTFYVNGKPLCNAEQRYGTRPEYTDSPEVTGHGAHQAITHISETTSCSDLGVLHIGDKLNIKVAYNTTLHPLNPNHEGAKSDKGGRDKFA